MIASRRHATSRMVATMGFVLAASSTACVQTPVFHTSGRTLRDPCGKEVLIRGVEAPIIEADTPAQIGASGSNFVRILINAPPGKYPTDPDTLAHWIADFAARGVAVDVMIDSPTGDLPYLRPEYKRVLLRYQDVITIHAVGESKQETDAEWLASAKQTIRALRDGGFRVPLYVLSREAGRAPRPILEHGQELVDFDPLHNILLGVQLYWGGERGEHPTLLETKYGMTAEQAIARFATLPFPVIVGINNHDPYTGASEWIDYERQLSATQKHRVGWFWWDWYNPFDEVGNYHLSRTGRVGDPGIAAAGAPNVKALHVRRGDALSTYTAADARASGFRYDAGESVLGKSTGWGDAAEWRDVKTERSAQAMLTLDFSNGSQHERPLTVYVNGSRVATFAGARTGSWSSWQSETVSVSLPAGPSTIQLVAEGTTGPYDTEFGKRTLLTDPASIAKTSVKSAYVQTRSCR